MSSGRHQAARSAFVGTFTDDATKAMQSSPRYFSLWYSIKSIALVGAIGAAAYYAGRSSGFRDAKPHALPPAPGH